jgi:hypothetical protein
VGDKGRKKKKKKKKEKEKNITGKFIFLIKFHTIILNSKTILFVVLFHSYEWLAHNTQCFKKRLHAIQNAYHESVSLHEKLHKGHQEASFLYPKTILFYYIQHFFSILRFGTGLQTSQAGVQ